MRKSVEKKTTSKKQTEKKTASAAKATATKVEDSAAEVSVEEKEAEAKDEPVKTEEPKAAEAKKETKTTGKTKTTAAAKKETKTSKAASERIVLQLGGRELVMEELIDRVKAAYVAEAEGHKADSINSINVYVKPEENMAYYVIDDYASGISLF